MRDFTQQWKYKPSKLTSKAFILSFAILLSGFFTKEASANFIYGVGYKDFVSVSPTYSPSTHNTLNGRMFSETQLGIYIDNSQGIYYMLTPNVLKNGTEVPCSNGLSSSNINYKTREAHFITYRTAFNDWIVNGDIYPSAPATTSAGNPFFSGSYTDSYYGTGASNSVAGYCLMLAPPEIIAQGGWKFNTGEQYGFYEYPIWDYTPPNGETDTIQWRGSGTGSNNFFHYDSFVTGSFSLTGAFIDTNITNKAFLLFGSLPPIATTTSIFFNENVFSIGAQTSDLTRIIDFNPQNKATTTSPVTFDLEAFINSKDLNYISGVRLKFYNTDINVVGNIGGFLPVFDTLILLDDNAVSAGRYFFSTTTPLAEGNYRVTAEIQRTYLNGLLTNPFSPISEQITHSFIVGSVVNGFNGTYLGNLSENGLEDLNNTLASTTHNISISSVCIPIKASGFFGFEYNASTSIPACLGALLVPTQDQITTTIATFRKGISTKFPIGYLTRFFDILNSNGTTSLPTFTAQIMLSPTATTSLVFDMGDTVIGAGTLLNSIKDPIHNKGFREVLEPFVVLMLALMLLFRILGDLTQVNIGFGSKGSLSDTASGDDSYRLKETLYKNMKRGKFYD